VNSLCDTGSLFKGIRFGAEALKEEKKYEKP